MSDHCTLTALRAWLKAHLVDAADYSPEVARTLRQVLAEIDNVPPQSATEKLAQALRLLRDVKHSELVPQLTLDTASKLILAVGRAQAYLLTADDCLAAAIDELGKVANAKEVK